jgi:hypothetical protein
VLLLPRKRECNRSETHALCAISTKKRSIDPIWILC